MNSKVYLLFTVLLVALSACKSEEEKRKEKLYEESKGVISKAMTNALVRGYLKSDETSKILAEWAKINVQSAEDGLTYSFKINRIIESGRAPEESEWRVAPASAGLASTSAKVDSVAIRDLAAKAAALKKKMRKREDDMKGVTWWYAPTTTQYRDRNSFHLYMGEEKDNVWLRLRIQYYADDWLFIEKYLVKADSNMYTIIPTSRVETDNDYGKIWETYDQDVTPTNFVMLRDISKAKVVKVRFEGRQYYKDRVLSAAEKQGIAQVLDLYEAMGGTER